MPRNLLINDQIHLSGDVGDPFGWGDGFTYEDVALALAEIGPRDVTVRINSGGGIATEGMAIYSLLKAHPGKVSVAVDGIAASAASLIAMAGDVREMRDGAILMIHDPSGLTIGTARQHEESARNLHKLADNYAAVYAAASGNDAKDVRRAMLATTWMTADEAVTAGYATQKIDDLAAAKASFDYRIYAHAPADLPMRARDLQPNAATAAIQGVQAMPEAVQAKVVAAAPENPATPQAVTLTETAQPELPAKAWVAGFYAAASDTGLSLADLNAIVAKAVTHDQAKDALIDAMAKKSADLPSARGNASVTVDARDRFVEGVTNALCAVVEGKPELAGKGNEFAGVLPSGLVYLCLERMGVRHNHRKLDREMVAQVMRPTMSGGMHSTSDFVNILTNVANKSMLKGFEETEETFQKWTAKGNLSDFKIATRVDLGLFGTLDKVEEGAEYKYGTVSDRKDTVALATYGKMFAITRQAIINDDLSAFSRIPAKLGRSAKRTIGNLVYAVLTGNPTLADNVALFHATHNNYVTTGSAMSVDTLDAGRSAMAKQKDPDEKAVALGIRPKYLLVPVALEGKARQFVNSTSEPGQANPNIGNRVAGLAEVVSEARLDANSLTAWYLAASPSQYDTVEVLYLNGIETPTLEQQNGWNVDGIEFKVRIDTGVKAWDHRGLYKATGAGA